VLGNVGLSGMSKVKALGSVSRAIIEKSVCTVLIVHYGGSQN
jgi:nucleotide-binding universal stress UspA family protein